MAARTLFAIGADLEALSDLLTEVGGEVTDADVDAAVSAWLAELAADEGEKLDRYYGLVRQLEGEAAVARSEADEYLRRAHAREKGAARLKLRLKQHLEGSGRKEVVTATGRKVCVQSNGGAAPVEIAPDLDLDAIDPRFVEVHRHVSRAAVGKALAAGETLPWARLGPRGTQLRFR